MKLNTVKRISFILLNIVTYVFLASCVLISGYSLLSSKSSDEAVSIFGYQVNVVETESMEKCEGTDVSGFEIGSIPVNSAVFIEKIPSEPVKAAEWYKELKVGDVLTFKYTYTRQMTVTHRIASIKENGNGGYIITLTGDNVTSKTRQGYQTINTSDSTSPNYVIGRVKATSHLLGQIIHMTREPINALLLITFPCVVIIMLEIFKLIKSSTDEKLRKSEETVKSLQLELEALKGKLSMPKVKNENE